MWKPEMYVAFAKDTDVQTIFQNQSADYGVLSESFKNKIYNNYFEIEDRPKYKGYEKFIEFHEQKTKKMIQLLDGTFDMQMHWRLKDILNLENPLIIYPELIKD